MSYQSFSSLPPEEEKHFLVFEQRTVATSKYAANIGLGLAVGLMLTMLIIVIGFWGPIKKPWEAEEAAALAEEEAKRAAAPAPAPVVAPPTPEPTPATDPAAVPADPAGATPPADGTAPAGTPPAGTPPAGTAPAGTAPADPAAPAATAPETPAPAPTKAPPKKKKGRK